MPSLHRALHTAQGFHHEESAINVARWQALEAKGAAIETALGSPLVFDKLPQRKGCRIGTQRTGGKSVDDREAWEDYLLWFEETQSKLRCAIAAVGGVPPMPEEAADMADDDTADQEDAECGSLEAPEDQL